jgi:hypothetical protein
MADNLQEHMYPTGDDSGAITAPPFAAQFKGLTSPSSTKTAYIDPRDWIDLLSRAFKDTLPHVNASIPGMLTP